jgi:hypothetical protein
VEEPVKSLAQNSVSDHSNFQSYWGEQKLTALVVSQAADSLHSQHFRNRMNQELWRESVELWF